MCVMISAPPAAAPALARGLVAQRLAACVQTLPMTAHYRWRDQIESDEEVLLLCKSPRSRLPALQDWVRAEHPYELPQITALPVEGGLPDYLDWVRAECRPEDQPDEQAEAQSGPATP